MSRVRMPSRTMSRSTTISMELRLGARRFKLVIEFMNHPVQPHAHEALPLQFLNKPRKPRVPGRWRREHDEPRALRSARISSAISPGVTCAAARRSGFVRHARRRIEHAQVIVKSP